MHADALSSFKLIDPNQSFLIALISIGWYRFEVLKMREYWWLLLSNERDAVNLCVQGRISCYLKKNPARLHAWEINTAMTLTV